MNLLLKETSSLTVNLLLNETSFLTVNLALKETSLPTRSLLLKEASAPRFNLLPKDASFITVNLLLKETSSPTTSLPLNVILPTVNRLLFGWNDNLLDIYTPLLALFILVSDKGNLYVLDEPSTFVTLYWLAAPTKLPNISVTFSLSAVIDFILPIDLSLSTTRDFEATAVPGVAP